MDTPSETAADAQHAVAPLTRLGDRWSTPEYEQLVEEIRSGLTIDEIAKAHGRPPGGITAACNRLLPPEWRESTRQHAPATLARFLEERPGEDLKIPPMNAQRPRPRARTSEPTLTPLPETARLDRDDEAVSLESGDAAVLAFEAVAWLEGKPREQQILRMRVGLDDAPHTLAEIGEQFSLSGERIRQIESRALTLLVRQARKSGTPGEALAALLRLPGPDGVDEAFADRIAALVASEFDAPARVAIPFLLCAAGVASPTARQVAVLARAAAERRRELETEERRTADLERRRAIAVCRADAAVSRWMGHASWPATMAAPPESGTLRALRLTGRGEAAGSFHSRKLDREVFYESSLELAALTVLENGAEIAWYQEQPLKIPYMWKGRQHVYYPDLLAATRAGRCLLIEVKPLMNMPVALNRAKAAAGRAYANERGWGWVTVDGTHTERDLETHIIPVGSLRAIAAELEVHGHLGWRQILELRSDVGVTPRDVAAFVIQTNAQLVLQPRYRIIPAR
ncbi:sigma factor-like helix-turn-helix DNA-binding protein [Kocuria carniphila]|uniref:Sigma factor-like helix-turn-helix DNA-binding protein n=1 Tax=Kocuria carniphila TaxID=262208 RepID=A0ABV3V8V6_9MICC